VISLLFSSIAFSQTDINNCKVSLPCQVAKQVASDLLRGDSALAELKETKDILELNQREITQYEDIVSMYVGKEENYKTQIDLFQQKETKYKYMVSGLEQDNKKLKLKVKIFGYGLTITSASIILGILLR
jgi:hypothetical protein